MAKIKIIKGDIFKPKSQVDMIVYRSKKATDTSFINSKYQNARYCFILPEYELDNNNIMDFLDYYKKPIRRARELKMRTMAIEAIDINNDELTMTFAAELAERLKEATMLYDVEVLIVCKNKETRDLYELAIFGQVSGAQVVMTDRLENNEVFIIPTKRKMMKWDNWYKPLRKAEVSHIFWKYKFGSELELGKFCLVNGVNCATFYYLVNFEGKRIKPDMYQERVIAAIKSVLTSMEFMGCHNMTVPILHFVKDEEQNRQLIEKLLEVVCDYIEDKEINIKLFCPEPDLWHIIESWFEG